MERKICFKWILPFDINVCPFLPDKYLRSPVFYLNESRKPRYCLKLNLREVYAQIRYKSLVLCRTDEDGIINAEFECDISRQQWGYAYPYVYKFPKDPKENSFNSFDKGSFTVTLKTIGLTCTSLKCLFTPESDGGEEDLEDLSRSIAMLLENYTFSDYNLYSLEKRQHKAHKTILKARCPELLEETTPNSNKYGGRISDKAIQVLFHYLYSGKLDKGKMSEELGSLLKELDLLPMYRLVSRFPGETTARTAVKKSFLDFVWVIDNFADLRGKHCYTVTEGDPFTWLKIILSVKKRKTKMRAEFMIHRIHNNSNIFLCCKLSAFLRNGSISKLEELKHFFENEKDWTFPFFFETDNLRRDCSNFLQNGSLKLRFEIAISNGEHETQITEVEYFPPSDTSFKRNLSKLGQDLNKLYQNSICPDVILNTGNGVIRAHKVILSARSKVFNSMFTHDTIEKRTSKVNITDIEEGIMRSVVSYMYSGQTKPIDYTNVFNLYYAVDKYAVLKLKEKCTRYLMSVLNFTNIVEILILADMHCDQELKQYVFAFTCNNSREALASKSWNDFMKEHHEFSFEAFREGLKFLGKLR